MHGRKEDDAVLHLTGWNIVTFILIAVQGGIGLVIKMQLHAASELVDAVH